MVAMTRQIEAAVQGLLVQVHEKQYEMEVEGDEMKRSLMQREAEKEQAAKMKGWDAERKRERALFNAEMAGDLTEEGEQKLMDKLNAKKEEIKRDVADDLEKDIDIARAELKTTTQDCERLEGTLIGLRTGAVGLYERLIPYFNLLEDQPDLVKKGAPDPKTIETAEALVLSEAMLVKMIELLGGGDNKDEGALVLED